MNSLIKTIAISMFMVIPLSAQLASRDVQFKIIEDMRAQMNSLEQRFLQPDENDISEAKSEGMVALRLLPREKYDGVLWTRGGGSYYSFVRLTHEYGQGSDIGLEQGRLKVGFAGADYGFLIDVGEMPLTAISENTPEATFLFKYRPPSDHTDVRAEQARANKYETQAATYSSYVPAIVGHTYLLRSIDFDRSDTLVALKVVRKDADGSLILYWKALKTFDKPTIAPESPVKRP